MSQHEVIVNVAEKDEAMVAVEAEGSPLELIGTAKWSATTPRGPEMHQTHQMGEAKTNRAHSVPVLDAARACRVPLY